MLALAAPNVEDHATLLNFEQLALILGGGVAGQVLTANAQGNAAFAAVPVNPLNAEIPTAVTDVSASRVVETAYQPSTTRPVFVSVDLYAESVSSVASSVQLLIGATSSPAQQGGVCYTLTTDASAAENILTVSVILPVAWYYKIHVNAVGAAQGFTVVRETVL